MIITNLKTNRITNPLGFELGRPSLSWIVSDAPSVRQSSARIEIALDAAFNSVVFDSGFSAGISSLGYRPDIILLPYTRYFWRVSVNGDKGDTATSDVAFFETAKMDNPWLAQWITPSFAPDVHPYLRKTFTLGGGVTSARLYAIGLGIYEVEINGAHWRGIPCARLPCL